MERMASPEEPLQPMPVESYPPGARPLPDRVTADEALGQAARLLHAAEMETNLALMERLEKLADSWMVLAGVLIQRDREV
jgi:hypothetical protein